MEGGHTLYRIRHWDTTLLSVFGDLVLPTVNTQRNLAPTLAGQAVSFCLFKKQNSTGFLLYFLLPSLSLCISLSFSCSLSLSVSLFLPFTLLLINSSPELCLHGVFVSYPPRSLARRIAVDCHHLRSGPTRRQGPSRAEIITPTTWTHFRGLSQHFGSFDHSFSKSL